MDNAAPAGQTPATGPPGAEVLKTRSESAAAAAANPPVPPAAGKKPGRKRTYRPSHKATFIGLAVVIAILAVNAVIFTFVLKKQSGTNGLADKGAVTISQGSLSKLGINKSTLGSSGVVLVVAPDAQFKGALTVSGISTFSGDVSLNGKITGTGANFSQLQAGNTSLSQLDVNGDGTLSSLNLRKDLAVAGLTKLQGAVTLSQLLTVDSDANIKGNLSIGGVLSVNTFNVRSLVVGGHQITAGPIPTASGGGALGSNGTTSISGNDAAGSIAINIGVGAVGGVLTNVTFNTAYATTPRVIITPVGIGAVFYISSQSTTGFSVAVTSGLPPGGYHINYIADQ